MVLRTSHDPHFCLISFSWGHYIHRYTARIHFHFRDIGPTFMLNKQSSMFLVENVLSDENDYIQFFVSFRNILRMYFPERQIYN